MTLHSLGNGDLLHAVKVASIARQESELQSAFQHSANVESGVFRKSLLRIVHLLRLLNDYAFKFVIGVLQNQEEQVLLAGDMVVESRFGHADRLGDVVDRISSVAFLHHQPSRRVEDFLVTRLPFRRRHRFYFAC